MSKVIKKQIKRSMPWLMIVSLVFSTAFGFATFNLNLDFQKKAKEIINWTNEVKADTAVTTVTVQNAYPTFSGNAAENPTSSSTSPVNTGASIGFTATANDPENNQYYLIVCSNNNQATAGVGGGAPSCGAGATQFCVSGATNSGSQASCTYSNVSSPAAETQNWYAFVCDNHTTQADCVPSSNQGSGDSGSPIYVNHAPTITSATTTVNFLEPGGTFTLQGNATDTDVQGGQDVITLDICSTNAWSTSTGCTVTTLCTGTSTSNPTCNYNRPVPAAHGATTYYAFIKDNHGLPGSGNSQSATYTINDVSPTISNVVLNSGNSINPLLKGVPEFVASTTSLSVQDNNGCQDIVGATSTIYMSNVAAGANCSADDNNCYPITSGSCAISDCSGSDAIATIVCSTTIAYHADPTDNSTNNSREIYYWLGSIRVYDENFSTSSVSQTSLTEFNTVPGIDITEASIAYGTIRSSFNSGWNNATTTVVNIGNSPLNADVSGTDMVYLANTIGANNQEYSLANFNWSTGTDLSSTTPATVNTDCVKPTSQSDITDQIFWGIGIPGGRQSGVYSGTNTFLAALDGSVLW